ncbi:hypothetical protein HJFPF1_05664 [Paramyrothecium foliicola]|nr:hypothetical protein HJFPF1_05664 [Paramyrothecium foliicola]
MRPISLIHFILTTTNTTTSITMKFSLAAAAGLVGLASAQNAVVHNNCAFPVYVQSVPFNGGAPGPLTTLQTGQRFSEPIRSTGSTVKIARTRTLTTPLFFGYSTTKDPNYAYYELSTEFGNPFSGYKNTLSPGDGCEFFSCNANNGACYSTPNAKKVFGCPQPVTLVTTVCAPGRS